MHLQMGISNILPPSLGRKHWDTWFLNSSKSKTRLKFMKLGMLSWSGINMPLWNFCPIWGWFGYKLLTNQSFLQQAWWCRYGIPHLWGWNDIHSLLLLSKNGAESTVVVNFFPFGAGLGISVSQTGASHNKREGFGRERATFGDETISIASYCFQKVSSVNIE